MWILQPPSANLVHTPRPHPFHSLPNKPQFNDPQSPDQPLLGVRDAREAVLGRLPVEGGLDPAQPLHVGVGGMVGPEGCEEGEGPVSRGRAQVLRARDAVDEGVGVAIAPVILPRLGQSRAGVPVRARGQVGAGDRVEEEEGRTVLLGQGGEVVQGVRGRGRSPDGPELGRAELDQDRVLVEGAEGFHGTRGQVDAVDGEVDPEGQRGPLQGAR